jgi:hypothetical protein
MGKTTTLIALALLVALAFAAGPSLPAEAGKAEAGLMVSNLGAPPAWKQKGYDRMSVTAPGFMSKTKTIQIPDFLKKIWAKEIAENDRQFAVANPELIYKDGHAHAAALWSVYQDGSRTVIISLLHTGKFCEEGPNDFHSTQIHSTCPIRVTVVQGQTVKNKDFPEGCFLDSTFDNAPGETRSGPDPAVNASLTRYDRQAGIVELIAIRDNRSLPQCTKRLTLPQ